LIREVAETVRQTTHVQVQMMMLANAARVLFQIQEHGEALALIREVNAKITDDDLVSFST
jgi:hypothetical protein